MPLAENVKKYREENKMTVRELAKKADVSYGYIGQIEKGLKLPNPYITQAIAKALGHTTDELLNQKG